MVHLGDRRRGDTRPTEHVNEGKLLGYLSPGATLFPTVWEPVQLRAFLSPGMRHSLRPSNHSVEPCVLREAEDTQAALGSSSRLPVSPERQQDPWEGLLRTGHCARCGGSTGWIRQSEWPRGALGNRSLMRGQGSLCPSAFPALPFESGGT